MQDNGEETFSWAADGTFVGSSDEIVALSGGASNFVPGSSVHAPNVAASSFKPKPVARLLLFGSLVHAPFGCWR